MSMSADEIVSLIKESLPDARVEVEDLRGDGHHYAAYVESAAFAGRSRVDQHRLVFAALQGRVGGLLEELTLVTVAVKGKAAGAPAALPSPPQAAPAVADRIEAEICAHDVVLYMNGAPVFPQCGPSAQAVQILGMMGVAYKAVDVMADPAIRQGIRDFSNWPTLPQLYIKGAFVGGVDILREMLQTGELQQMLAADGG